MNLKENTMNSDIYYNNLKQEQKELKDLESNLSLLKGNRFKNKQRRIVNDEEWNKAISTLRNSHIDFDWESTIEDTNFDPFKITKKTLPSQSLKPNTFDHSDLEELDNEKNKYDDRKRSEYDIETELEYQEYIKNLDEQIKRDNYLMGSYNEITDSSSSSISPYIKEKLAEAHLEGYSNNVNDQNQNKVLVESNQIEESEKLEEFSYQTNFKEASSLKSENLDNESFKTAKSTIDAIKNKQRFQDDTLKLSNSNINNRHSIISKNFYEDDSSYKTAQTNLSDVRNSKTITKSFKNKIATEYNNEIQNFMATNNMSFTVSPLKDKEIETFSDAEDDNEFYINKSSASLISAVNSPIVGIEVEKKESPKYRSSAFFYDSEYDHENNKEIGDRNTVYLSDDNKSLFKSLTNLNSPLKEPEFNDEELPSIESLENDEIENKSSLESSIMGFEGKNSDKHSLVEDSLKDSTEVDMDLNERKSIYESLENKLNSFINEININPSLQGTVRSHDSYLSVLTDNTIRPSAKHETSNLREEIKEDFKQLNKSFSTMELKKENIELNPNLVNFEKEDSFTNFQFEHDSDSTMSFNLSNANSMLSTPYFKSTPTSPLKQTHINGSSNSNVIAKTQNNKVLDEIEVISKGSIPSSPDTPIIKNDSDPINNLKKFTYLNEEAPRSRNSYLPRLENTLLSNEINDFFKLDLIDEKSLSKKDTEKFDLSESMYESSTLISSDSKDFDLGKPTVYNSNIIQSNSQNISNSSVPPLRSVTSINASSLNRPINNSEWADTSDLTKKITENINEVKSQSKINHREEDYSYENIKDDNITQKRIDKLKDPISPTFSPRSESLYLNQTSSTPVVVQNNRNTIVGSQAASIKNYSHTNQIKNEYNALKHSNSSNQLSKRRSGLLRPKSQILSKLKSLVIKKSSSNLDPSSTGLLRLFKFDNHSEEPELVATTNEITRDLFVSSYAFLLECEYALYIWYGKRSNDQQKKSASNYAEKFLKLGTSTGGLNFTIRVEFEGQEHPSFTSRFSNWLTHQIPSNQFQSSNVQVSDLRSSLERIYKQKPKEILGELDDVEMISLKIWTVRGSDHIEIPQNEHGLFYNQEYYLIVYRYKNSLGILKHNVFYWIGNQSKQAKDPISKPTQVMLDGKYEALMIHVLQGKEPEAFFKIFGGYLVTRKGTRRTFLSEKIMYHVSGLKQGMVHINQTVCHPKFLCSGHTFILTSRSKTYIWHGIGSFLFERLAAVIATRKLLGGSSKVIEIREKLEPKKFWLKFSESKKDYADELLWARKPFLQHGYNLRLFKLQFKGEVQIEEIFSFTQADLNPNYTYLLDGYFGIYLWSNYGSIPNPEVIQYLNLCLDYSRMINDLNDRDFQLKPILVVPDHESAEFISRFKGWSDQPLIKPSTLKRKTSVRSLPVEYLLKKLSQT